MMMHYFKIGLLSLTGFWLVFCSGLLAKENQFILKAEAENAKGSTVGPEKGTLVIMGGGGKDRAFSEIFKKFIELAGGKKARIVIVPTAASSSLEYDYSKSLAERYARSLNVENVTIVHTHNPKVADTEIFVQPIKDATGVWFNGGRQWRYVKAYGGTKSEEEFRNVLKRGGVIGGSSAGASIQGSFLARGDTRGNRIMIGDVQRGFGYMRDTAIDQHVIARGRQRDLLKVLEDPRGAMREEFDRAELLGIGIDEDVAIIVKANELEVIGKNKGEILIFDPKKWDHDSADEKKWEVLQKGDKYDLGKRKKIQ